MRGLLAFFPSWYIFLVCLLFWIGPWKFPDVSIGFSLYLAVVLLAILFGQVTGMALGNRLKFRVCHSNNSMQGRHFLNWSIVISWILIFPTFYARTGSIFPDIIYGITYPGEAYRRGIEAAHPGLEYIRILFSPLLFIFLPLSVKYYSVLPLWRKGLVVLFVLANFALYISMGVNRGIVDYIVGGVFLYFVHISASSGLRIKSIWKIGLLLTPIFVGALVFFASGQLLREGSGAPIGYYPAADLYSSIRPQEIDDPLLRFVAVIYNQLTIYLVQGFYGAGLIFERGIEFSLYGVGNSDFLIRNAAKIFGDSVYHRSAIYAYEYSMGWLHGNFWFSIIPWVASDIGFAGVIFFSFLSAFAYSLAFFIYKKSSEWLSFCILAIFFYMFLYFPANNYMAQSGEYLLASLALLFLWVIRVVRTGWHRV